MSSDVDTDTDPGPALPAAGGLRARLDLPTFLRQRAPVLLALAGLAVAQPQLDLFGRNPAFFVASDYTKTEIVAFALIVAFAVPVAAMVLELAVTAVGGSRAGEWAHRVLIAVLAFAFALVIARHLDWEALPVVAGFAAVVAAAVVFLAHRFAGFRLLLRYLAFAPVAFVLLFLFASPSAELLWEGEAEAETGIAIGRPAPVVFIMLDEVPVASLMTPRGDIDEQRFPNFARLAATSTWYRNATAVAPNTDLSVPSSVTGLIPSPGEVPTSFDHPRNLFTLLGGQFEMQVTETVTDLCPIDLCADSATGARRGFLDQIRRGMGDAGVVYGHQTLPEAFRTKLAAIDQSFGGFLDEDVQLDAAEAEGEATSVKGETLRAAIEDADLSSPDTLIFIHEVFPHFNWIRTPTGGLYDGPRGPPGARDRWWLDDEFLIRQAFQRHLLQLGYADTLLGRLLDRLEEAELGEDALVVVTADHGISFRAGEPRRRPNEATIQELFWVPLFVKFPGQTTGVVDDGNARLIDIVPTVVDVLDIEVAWELDGVSLVADGPRPVEKPTVGGSDRIQGGVEEIFATTRRNAAWIPAEGWLGVVQVGRWGPLVGRDVGELEVTGEVDFGWRLQDPEALADYDPATDPLPLVVTGRFDPQDGGPPTEALIALNGRVAGVVGFPTVGREGRFTALLDETAIVAGANEVQLYLPEGSASDPVLRLARPRG